MDNTVLIIGANSCVANAISGSFSDLGYVVDGTYLNHIPQNTESYSNFFKVDFSNHKEVLAFKNQLLKYKDIIFTIGTNEYLDEKKSEINFTCLENLIRVFVGLKNGPRILFCSSTAVYGDNDLEIISEESEKKPLSIYAKHKIIAEEMLSQSGCAYIVLRFPIVFGRSFKKKFHRLESVIKSNGATVFGDGSNKFSLLYESDLVSAFNKLLKNRQIKNVDINISSGSMTQLDLITKIKAVLKSPIDVNYVSVEKAITIANEQLQKFKSGGTAPSLYKEDVVGFSRNRVYSCVRAKSLLNLDPKFDLDGDIFETFDRSNFMDRGDGLRILRRVLPNKSLQVRTYESYLDFSSDDFAVSIDCPIWSVTVRDKNGDVVNTKHFFSKTADDIKKFMLENDDPRKNYSVRLSPVKEDILYYGSFLFDSTSFGEKIIITMSKKGSADFVKVGNGEMFKLLPRDLNPDMNLFYVDGKIFGNIELIHVYEKEMISDIEKLKDHLCLTKRQDKIAPVLFIINEKLGLQYISMGF